LASKTQTAGYVGVLAACFAAGMLGGWFGVRINDSAYDLMSEWAPLEDRNPQSVVVAIDEETLKARGGQREIRSILAETLDAIAPSKPKAVALDVILADELLDPAGNARLEASMLATPNLILPCEVVKGAWEDPLDRFKRLAVALGHVQSDDDASGGVSREIPLEAAVGGQRRWALSLEAFRVANHAQIVESPEQLEVGGLTIPAARADSRALRIQYLRPGVTSVSALEASQHLEMFRDKTVFVGVTALSMARDRRVIPSGGYISGVELHAYAFETLANGRFLPPASDLNVLAVCAGFAAAAGLIFATMSGWPAYLSAIGLLAIAHVLPYQLFRHNIRFPYLEPVLVAWLSSVGAATYQHFVVRRKLHRTESEKSRYQQAIHWAAHEMRTPLTSIQGSSEIMSRYKLPEEKRTQLNEMINSESKRLARIIQTFLDVERLAQGQVEMKRESFAAADLVAACVKRVGPLAERKQIALTLDSGVEGTLTGDRELMEYALYNLLTNAVKYSPSGTQVRVFSELRGGELRLAVQDQGIGMDAKELKNIFRKFYRTKRAEASGEVGTGIGLSIVEQIVTHHGGRIDVTSTPGKGSCFTMCMTATAPNAETLDRRR
jgi:signal transduction histidine kinase